MKRTAFIIICLCIGIVLTGCEQPIYRGKDKDLFSAGTYSIIGSDRYGYTSTEIIEKDNYGRTLFYFYFRNLFFTDVTAFRSYMTGLCICQYSDAELVYFYEDVCTQVVPKEKCELSDFDVEKLKLNNDWNKPLEYSKMTTREYAPCYGMGREYDIRADARITVCVQDIFPQSVNYRIAKIYGDTDKNGKMLFLIRVCDLSYGWEDKYLKTYIMILNADCTYDEDTCIQEIDDVVNYFDEVHELKLRNGWRFE